MTDIKKLLINKTVKNVSKVDNGKCINIIGSYFIVCQAGYHLLDNICVDTDECDEDGEPIERTIYHLVGHCPEYYFKLHFYRYYNTNPTLRRILDELNVKSSDVDYYKMSPELIKYYNEKRIII